MVDAHCHLGTKNEGLGSRDLLKAMDAVGVSKAVICPIEKYVAVYNKEGNNYISKAVKQHPKRMIGFATVNPWFGKAAVVELKRSIKMGLKGLKLNPFLQGFQINDVLVHPVVETCESLNIPIYFHTGTPVSSEPLQLTDLARKFPQVNFIMGHMGWTDFWYDATPAAEKSTNIFLETSHSNIDFIKTAFDTIGAKRILFGSDIPNSDLLIEYEKFKFIDMSDEDREMIQGRNILKIIGEE